MKKLNWGRTFDLFCIGYVIGGAIQDFTKGDHHAAVGYSLCAMLMVFYMFSQERCKSLQERLNRALGKF